MTYRYADYNQNQLLCYKQFPLLNIKLQRFYLTSARFNAFLFIVHEQAFQGKSGLMALNNLSVFQAWKTIFTI